MSPPPTDEITTMEAAEILGVTDRSTVVRMVRERRLTPSRKLPGKSGAYLFWRHDVQRLAVERAAFAGAIAKVKAEHPELAS